MVQYPIGKVAKTFGFTKEALRFYERAGILIPQRDENGYRYYTNSQLQRVAVIKRMQNIGFSLKEIAAMLTAYSDQRLFQNLERCIQAKQHELDYQQALLKRLKADVGYYCDGGQERPTLVDLPERYAFYFDDVEKLVNDVAIRPDILRWYNRMYPALGLETVKLSDMEQDNEKRRIGLLADKRAAEASGFLKTGNITRLLPCRAVHFSARLQHHNQIFRPFYERLAEAERALGVCCQGTVHVVFNFSYRAENEEMVYMVRVYAPIEELSACPKEQENFLY